MSDNKLRDSLRRFLAQAATEETRSAAKTVHGVEIPEGSTNLQVLEAIYGPTVEVEP